MNLKIAYAFLVGLTLGIIFLNIPPGLTVLIELYGTTYTGIAILMSALLWTHALMQIPAGVITDRLGIRYTLIIGIALMTIGNAIPIVFPRLGWAVAGRVLTGLGTGTSLVSAMKTIASYAPEGKAGSYQAFFAAAFSAGNILAYLLIPVLIPFGWWWTYLVPVICCAALWLMWFGLSLKPRIAKQSPPQSLGRVLKIRSGWIIGFYHALSYGSILALGNWIPTLLAESSAATTSTGLAWVGALAMLTGGLSRVAGGFVLYRISARMIANGTMGLMTALFIVLFWTKNFEPVLILALLAIWVAGFNYAALYQTACYAVEAESVATILGLVNFLANLGAIAFTMFFGLAKDITGSLSWGFVVMAICGIAAIICGRKTFKPAN